MSQVSSKFYFSLTSISQNVTRVRCFKQIWKVGKVGRVGKVCRVGKVGKVGKVGRAGF
jgi:hypothetical protein